MKSFITALSSLFLFTSLIASTTFAQQGEFSTDPTGSTSCLQMVNWNLTIPDTVVFDLQGCWGKQQNWGLQEGVNGGAKNWQGMHDGIKNYLLQRSGYEFGWYHYNQVSPEGAVALLQTDHTSGDGSPALSEESINALLNIYTNPSISNYMEVVEYADSYMGGTGVTHLVIMYTSDFQYAIVVEKFTYAE